MKRLLSILNPNDIPEKLHNTPYEELFRYHNFRDDFRQYKAPKIIIGTCMDHRVKINIPHYFAFVIRTGGANLKHNEFHISYALGVGNVQHLAIIGHTDCGMANLFSRKDVYVKGIVQNTGWDRTYAHDYFMEMAPRFEIDHEIDFVVEQTLHLRKRFPNIQIAPMIYRVEDGKIYLVKEE